MKTLKNLLAIALIVAFTVACKNDAKPEVKTVETEVDTAKKELDPNAEYAKANLGTVVHVALVKEHLSSELIGHVSRDSTAITGREKPAKKIITMRSNRSITHSFCLFRQWLNLT